MVNAVHYRTMEMSSALSRDLARRLLAVEAASKIAPNAHVHEAVRVCEKLRISLTRFAGSDGFTSLLRRALALASADFPSVETVKLTPPPWKGLKHSQLMRQTVAPRR